MTQPPESTPASAESALRDGRLDEALAMLQVDVRKKPQDKALRVFLFQLLAVNGAWASNDPEHMATYGLMADYAIGGALDEVDAAMTEVNAAAAEIAAEAVAEPADPAAD